MFDKISSGKIYGSVGNTFAAIEIDGDGVVIRNAADEHDSSGSLITAGSDEVLSANPITGTTINASYIKTGVIDANLMRAGLIQTVPSWNTKWYGAPEDHAAVQMGFTGGSIAATAVSTGSGTVSLTLPGGHGLITGDYVRVSGLYFTTGTLLGGVGLNLPTNGPLDYASATVATNTLTYSKADITSGLTASTSSTVYVGKAHTITAVVRSFDDPENPAELSTVVVTTSAAHGFSVGEYVELVNVAPTIDGVAYITAVTSTTFTFKQRFGADIELDLAEVDSVLPDLGAPVAIKVLKSYTQNADGSIHITSGTVDSTLIVGEIAATEITIGSGENVVRVGTNVSPAFQGIWAGSANPSTAEFSANTAGAVTAANLTVTGGSINIGDNFVLSTVGQITNDLVLAQKFIKNENGVELISTESDGGNSYALSPSLSRAITTGVINGDFGAAPPTLASNLNNSTNSLPYFTTEVSHTDATAPYVQVITDSTVASGKVLRFIIPSGAAVGRYARIVRYVSVPGSAARTFTNQPRAAWRNATGTTKTQSIVTIRSQYYKGDGVTTTGTQGTNSATFSTISAATYAYETQANPEGTGAIPNDGAYLKIEVGVEVSVLTTSEMTVDLTEVRIDQGNIQYLVTDQSQPELYGPASLYLFQGTLFLSNGGIVGSEPRISLSANSGDISINATGQGDTITLTSAARASSTVTIVTTRAHGLATGYEVIVAGITGTAGATMNGTHIVTVTSTTSFTYTSAGTAGSTSPAVVVTGATVKSGPGSGIIYLKPAATAAGKVQVDGDLNVTGAITGGSGTTFDLTGDVTVTAGSFTLGAANSYVVSVDNDSHTHTAATLGILTLGTDTNGNYVGGITSANSLIAVSGSGGEGTTVTLTADTTPTFTSITTTSGAELAGSIDLNSTVSATSLAQTSNITNSRDVRIFFGTGGGLAQWRVFQDSSSLRYKTNIVDLPDSDAILDVTPITYHDKLDYEERGEESARQYGFLAEDMAENIDGQSYVVYNEDGTPEAIQYSRLAVPLHSAMRKLRSRIDELEARLAELETGA